MGRNSILGCSDTDTCGEGAAHEWALRTPAAAPVGAGAPLPPAEGPSLQTKI